MLSYGLMGREHTRCDLTLRSKWLVNQARMHLLLMAHMTMRGT